jgi:hypothetical protein
MSLQVFLDILPGWYTVVGLMFDTVGALAMIMIAIIPRRSVIDFAFPNRRSFAELIDTNLAERRPHVQHLIRQSRVAVVGAGLLVIGFALQLIGSLLQLQ